MAKLYDIVETSKMASEYDGSLINVEGVAKTDLENGRLVAVDADGTIRYAVAGDAEVFLHASVEVMADTTKGLTEFKKLQGEKVRKIRFRKGDVFKTTAIDGTIVAGDTVKLSTNGTFVKVASPAGTENFLATVKEVGSLGFYSFSYGFDKIPAIKLEVTKA